MAWQVSVCIFRAKSLQMECLQDMKQLIHIAKVRRLALAPTHPYIYLYMMFVNTSVYWCINIISDIEKNMHIHVYAHMCEYLPHSCAYTWACVRASYGRLLLSLCYWGFYVIFSIVIEILCTGSRRWSMSPGTMSSLAVPGAVIMTVSCAASAACVVVIILTSYPVSKSL